MSLENSSQLISWHLYIDTGTWLWAERMKWSYSKLWHASPRTVLLADGVIEGYRKSHKNFGFYWINRAGHMVMCTRVFSLLLDS